MILKKRNKVLSIILCRIGSKRLKNKLFLRINDQFILKDSTGKIQIENEEKLNKYLAYIL